MASVLGPMPTPDQLAQLVPPVPPLVSAAAVSERPQAAAALLAWGSTDPGWHAGLAFIYNMFRGSPLRALITVWVPAVNVTRRAGEDYARVPRVRLDPQYPARWPALPARYPNAGPEWLSKHAHAPVADPDGEYRELRDEIRRLSRG